MGFFFVSISKNQEMFQMIGTLYMMTSMFLGGLIFPSNSAE
jgi:hypothetical protein